MRTRLFPGLLLVSLLAVGACGDPVAPPHVGGWAQVAAGDFFSCGLTTAGQAYCWGSAVFGQLGNDAVVSTAAPVAVAGGHTFRALAVGSDHVCGLDVAGAAWCWGLNDYHELGAATSACNPGFVFASCARVPIAVSGARSYDSIVVAGYSTCALSAGTTWCWGWNVHGQVGSGPVGGTSNVPAAILSSRHFVSLTLDISHACGLTASDSIFCWGSNIYGQLAADTLQTPRCGGGGGFFCTVSPVYAAPGLVAGRVSAGSTHTCALVPGGDAYCWGSNEYGVLGNPAALGGRVPVLVAGGHGWSAISAGADHTCALDADGAAWCWGVNAYGQLGVPAATISEACHAFGSAQVCRTSPIAVASAFAFAEISAGSSHTCGLTPDGDLWCWGRGLEGQLGNGLTQTSHVPVRVEAPGGP